MKKTFLFLTILILSVTPKSTFANGFGINEHGAKAVAMGGAFAAQADDPTTLYFNPAGITQLEGSQFSVGTSVITPSASFKDDITGKVHDSEKPTFLIPNLYYTQKINHNLSAGVAVFSNFGLSTEWKDDFPGRYLLGGRRGSIETISINPVVAYKVLAGLSISAGPVYQIVKADFDSNIDTMVASAGDADLHLKDLEDQAWGWNVAMHYILNKNWKFGASYRSSIKHELKGKSETSGVPNTGVYSLFNQNISADLELPPVAYFGVAHLVNKWTFEIDAQWTGWSTYDELNVPELGKSSAKNWNDAWTYRLGVERKFNQRYALRFGVVRDMSPIPAKTIDVTLPSGDRWLVGGGLGMQFGDLVLDLAYNYLMDEGGTFNNEAGADPLYPIVKPRVTGDFDDIDAHIFSMSVSYKF
ncbi:MAG: outer membrane protein transport protein [Geopsychrobacter sp.]|nr:outer membrane protein transport protein [Geopsychrobacter sp.]